MSEELPLFKTPLLQRILKMVRAEMDPDFTFISPGALPWVEPSKSINDLGVALITTGGLHLKNEPGFRALELPMGDTSFRKIPHLSKPSTLVLSAPYVDQKYTPKDPEVALPMRALEQLHSQGRSGPPAKQHYSFCGGILRPKPGLSESVDELETLLQEDAVGIVILLPTCSICVQTVCLLARDLEARGFITVSLSLLPELSEYVGAPRTLTVPFPFGAPCGDPNNEALHQGVLAEALDLIVSAKKPGELRDTKHAWRK